ncbi:MAG: putative DNA binding domain-containing protein [Mycoplasma sp.]
MEDARIEYKQELPERYEKILKDICAFLNTNGGTIFLGVDDNGHVLEDKIPNYKNWEEILINWISSCFDPSVQGLVNLFPGEVPFRIEVKEGSNKPYSISNSDSLDLSRIYYRVGSSSRIVSKEQCNWMLTNHSKFPYEEWKSPIQELTFNTLTNALKNNSIPFSVSGLKLKNKNGEYNNLALLLSDQNPTVSKFAVYGDNVLTFSTRKTLTGSIIEQLNKIFEAIGYANQKKEVINSDTFLREGLYDYPAAAIREAVVNAFMHRNWQLDGSDIRIEFFNDRLEILSPGGACKNLTVEDITKSFLTARRNNLLAKVFQKLNLTEDYGTGMRKIFDSYQGFDKKPEVGISPNAFVIKLFNRNYIDPKKRKYNQTDIIDNDKENQKLYQSLDDQYKKIINLMKQDEKVSLANISKKTNICKTKIYYLVDELKNKQIIKRCGPKQGGYWIVAI